MDELMSEQMDRQTDKCKCGRIEGWIDKGYLAGKRDGWMDRWMDGRQTDGQTDGRTDGWMMDGLYT